MCEKVGYSPENGKYEFLPGRKVMERNPSFGK
jgi:hypothetical protein